MLEFRLKALEQFYKMPMPQWGGNMDDLDFDDIQYYVKPSEKQGQDLGRSSGGNQAKLSTSWAFRKRSRSFLPAYPPSTNPKSFITACRKNWRSKA